MTHPFDGPALALIHDQGLLVAGAKKTGVGSVSYIIVYPAQPLEPEEVNCQRRLGMPKRLNPLKLAAELADSNSGQVSVPKLNLAASSEAPTMPFPSPFGLTPLVLAGGLEGQNVHGRGSLLFTEGQPATGVFVLEKGLVKLSMCSGRGKSLILGFFGPRTVLGLPAAILGLPHANTAEIMKPVTARFLARGDLLRHLRQSRGAGLRVAELVSQMLYSTFHEMEMLCLTDSVEQRLAQFLLSSWPRRPFSRALVRVRLDLTHEDIARKIGVSRETVTRTLSRFKRKGLLELKQSTLAILDFDALERVADLPDVHRAERSEPRAASRVSLTKESCG